MHRNNDLPPPPHYSPFPITVYPDQLNSRDAWVLAYILLNSPRQPFYDAVDIHTGRLIRYDVPLPDPNEPSKTRMQQVYLSAGLTRFVPNKYSDEYRYAVHPVNAMSSGFEGKVYLSAATIRFEKDEEGFLEVVYDAKTTPEKKRVVKRMMKPDDSYDHRSQNDKASREWGFVHRLYPDDVKAPILTEDNSSAALVMRFIPPGKTLQYYLHQDRAGHYKKSGIFKPFRFSLYQRFMVTIRLAQSITLLHENSIIHRDVKPENFIMNAKNYLPDLKAIDFGLSKWIGEQLDDDDCVGTIGYMSPEAQHCQTSDEKSDGYAYAKMLKKYLWRDSHDDRYNGLTDEQMLRIKTIIMKGLHEDPKLRASIKEMVVEIAKVFREYHEMYKAGVQQNAAATVLKPN